MDLRLRGFDVKLCCFMAVQQRDEAGLQGRMLIFPFDSPRLGGCPMMTIPCTAASWGGQGLVLSSPQLSGQPLVIGFSCRLLLTGHFGTFKSQ